MFGTQPSPDWLTALLGVDKPALTVAETLGTPAS